MTLKAHAVGSSTIEYQWRFRGAPISDGVQNSGAVISGARSDQLIIENVQAEDEGDYDCLVTNGYGQSVLDSASLRLGNPADLTGDSEPTSPGYGIPDGSLSADDFFFFLDAFMDLDSDIADVSGSSDPADPSYGVPDGQFDASDFLYYLDLFSQPCL